MAGTFSVGDEADEQNFAVGPVWRLLAEFVAQQPERPPGAQLLRHQADDVRVFSWLRNELEVMQPDLVERQLIRSHGPPTS